MGIALQVKSGPLAGQILTVRTGQSIVIGRTPDRAQFAVPHDNQMSGAHFAVECNEKGSRVIDQESSNGTFLNGARAKEATLANGDEIKSGQTVFVVRIVPDGQLSSAASHSKAATLKPPSTAAPPFDASPNQPARATPAAVAANPKPSGSAALPLPQVAPPTAAASSVPPALAIGNWAFRKIPDRWQVLEGFGIQQIVKDAFPATIGVIEEPMGPGLTLVQYVKAHTKMFRENLPEPKIDNVAPPAILGSEEAAALEIRFAIEGGPAIYWLRVYVRSGSTLGVLMLTTLEKDLSSVRPVHDSVLFAVSFCRKD